eukprot:TRINITY_DN624_c0_g2_i1.p1 TRINITY_DN624_c0_g2~~TRINITY_DN624_c0_g2_i1.p1  ORF type:complete len:480 (-),score=82.54 TRINITY_DN624_c0_g2_i1:71-1477(-)
MQRLFGKKKTHGSYVYPSGDKYTGEWKNGKKNGYGVAEFVSGNRYEGEWVDDVKHGQGTIKFAEGTSFTGQWVNDQKHGYGVAQFASGNRYEGEWKHDVMEGHGVFKYAAGDVYDGEWANGRICGKGTWVSADGKVRYDGMWNDGLRHGKGMVEQNGRTFRVEYVMGTLTKKESADGRGDEEKRHRKSKRDSDAQILPPLERSEDRNESESAPASHHDENPFHNPFQSTSPNNEIESPPTTNSDPVLSQSVVLDKDALGLTKSQRKDLLKQQQRAEGINDGPKRYKHEAEVFQQHSFSSSPDLRASKESSVNVSESASFLPGVLPPLQQRLPFIASTAPATTGLPAQAPPTHLPPLKPHSLPAIDAGDEEYDDGEGKKKKKKKKKDLTAVDSVTLPPGDVPPTQKKQKRQIKSEGADTRQPDVIADPSAIEMKSAAASTPALELQMPSARQQLGALRPLQPLRGLKPL